MLKNKESIQENILNSKHISQICLDGYNTLKQTQSYEQQNTKKQ
ncbi:unnamed protein product [Paramecium pentaurelia]|uniref:Uncharacterized protein n=1 Tax=Paramecium pentaurelia TaxID=43138 RepID=A0A8S1SXT9_9CILI|nr:unnamed protein product [Paramecium pentaurelia]